MRHLSVLLVLLSACALPNTGHSLLANGPHQQALFYTSTAGLGQIFLLDLASQKTKALTAAFPSAYNPSLSADGKTLVYSALNGEQVDLFIQSTQAGSTARNLTQNSGRDDFAQWSPDNQRLVFHSDRSGREQIYVIQADGTGLKRISPENISARFPQWSPQGDQVAFVATRPGGGQDIYRVHADGSDLRNLTSRYFPAFSPRWSPDGQTLAFVGQEAGKWNLYRMDANGDHLKRLATHDEVLTPSWSPDGSQLAYIARQNTALTAGEDETAPAQDAEQTLFVIQADGSNARELVGLPGAIRPLWLRDGKALLFQSSRTGTSQLYLINLLDKQPKALHPSSQEEILVELRKTSL